LRLADYVIEEIAKTGCKYIFLITGRGALFLNDAVARSDKLSGIPMHHEQAVGYASAAYAQNRESIGACLISTGCASTNTVTSVLSAWQDGIPCIFISGQNVLLETTYHTKKKIRTFGQQEANIIDIVKPITKYATMIEKPQDIVFELNKAIHIAQEGRKGPVWIDIPLDLQSSNIDPLKHIFQKKNQSQIHDIDYSVSQVENFISKSERPIMIIGHGIRSSKSIAKVKNFQKKTGIPVAYSASCPDVFSYSDDICVGSIGTLACSRSGNFAVQNSDLILIFGNRMNSIVTGDDCSKFGRAAKKVMIDIDKTEANKSNLKLDYFVEADISTFLEKLNSIDFKNDFSFWLAQCKNWKTSLPSLPVDIEPDALVDLYTLSSELNKLLPDNAVLVTDSGSIELIVPNNFNFCDNRRSIHPSSQGAMGYALPAAIGSYFADKKPTYAIVGDGSIMMNIQELQTISHFLLPITIFIVNNNMYSIIRKRQKELFRKRKIGVDPETGVSAPSFKKIAETFKFDYKTIKNNKDLFNSQKSDFIVSKPTIIEVFGLETQQYISTSHAKTSSGKYEMRPIEDQSPFIDRDVFLSNMIIQPINQ
jgi:acetolactate synthase I/II/III large subunit